MHDHDYLEATIDGATDPVCGMSVDPTTATHIATHGGEQHYFCSAGCLAKFEADPDHYAAKDAGGDTDAPEGAIWTCPMHPEIQRPGPGSCPICGMALERMEKVDTLVVDKTGTLTEGKPSVVAIEVADGFEEQDLLRIGASLERSSEHPLAAAIVKAAEDRGLALAEPSGVDQPVGKGIVGVVDDKAIVLGNASFLEELARDPGELAEAADRLRADGATAIYIAVNGKAAGVIAIADPVKETTGQALAALREAGIKVIMLTGDNRVTAEAIARRLGIDDVEADVLPDQKSAVVQRLREQGRIVAMAGDGVNDAPALAAADVGIAMGTGTDVAIESAGVTLLRGDLLGIVGARHLSHATMANIRQNLFFAFAYNAAGIPVAAGVLYPVFGLLLSPIIAAAAMALSSVSVIANSLRLRFVQV